MHRIATLLLGLVSLAATAQQQTFEFFSRTGVQHPLPSPTIYVPSGTDDKGRTWTVYTSPTTLTFANNKDTTRYSVARSSSEKPGYEYSTYGWIKQVDHNYLIEVFRGAKYSQTNPTLYDYYVPKADSTGKTSLLYLNDIGFDSTDFLSTFGATGGKVLAVSYQGKYAWEGTPDFSLQGPQFPTLVSDQQNTLYAYKAETQGIFSFHADGTMMKRLENLTLKNIAFQSKGSVIVYTTSGVYQLTGKTTQLLDLPSASALLRTSSIQPLKVSNGKLTMDLTLTTKGFNVREGGRSTTYLFAGKADIGKDSLTIGSFARLQPDSTLLLTFSFYSGKNGNLRYVFAYKNGVATFLNSYDLQKAQIQDVLVETYYKSTSSLYAYIRSKAYSGVISLNREGVATWIPSPSAGPCYLDPITGPMVADEQYLWIDNSYLYAGNCAVARMRHDAFQIQGKVFYDTNGDGSQGANELPYDKIRLTVLPSGLQLFPDAEGRFGFQGEPGKSYFVRVVDSTRFASIKINGYQVGVKLKVEQPTYSTVLTFSRSRCATEGKGTVNLANTGVTNLEKVVIRLVARNFAFTDLAASQDTLVLTSQSLSPRTVDHLTYDITWPDASKTGETATLYTYMDVYAQGAVVERKVDSLQTIIRCSYDPNDKSVSPVGVGNNRYTLKSSTLKYKIRFENTGNDTAYQVRIQDTLSPLLDLATFEVLGSSHKVVTELSPAGIVSFGFNNIGLPDSTTNKAGAQGYVSFSIKPRSGLVDEQVVCNTASIYFDLNPPVVTNSTCNLLVDKLPTVVTSLSREQEEQALLLYPNPANDWLHLARQAQETEVYDALGNLVLRTTEQHLPVGSLRPGVYVAKVRVSDTNTVRYPFMVVH